MTLLLAKSAGSDKQARTLFEHTFDVAEAFVALFGAPDMPTRLTERWVAFFKIASVDGFLSNGLAATLIHDWGKANDGFQEMLDHRGRQLVRHEHLSAMLMHLPQVRQWLSRMDGLDEDVILSAVVTHHLQASYESAGKALSEPDLPMRGRWDHPDFQQMLSEIADRLRLAGPVPASPSVLWSFEPQVGDLDLAAHLLSLKRRLSRFDGDLANDLPRRHLLWGVRSALIAADAAGSALVRESHPVTAWISVAVRRREHGRQLVDAIENEGREAVLQEC